MKRGRTPACDAASTKEIGRDEVCLMYGGSFVTTTNSLEHLILQPCQIRFQMAENLRG